MPANVPPSSSASSHDSPATDIHDAAILKSYSCILCAQRKVKCDKVPGGCSNCARVRVSCIYRPPPPPRRRKKGVRELDVHTRLKIYEATLRNLGVDPAELENIELSRLQGRKTAGAASTASADTLPKDPTSPPAGVDQGMLVSEEGKSRYLDNGLWIALKTEFRDSKVVLDESSSDEDAYSTRGTVPHEASLVGGADILLGSPGSIADIRLYHPQPVQIFRLWQAYLDNVNSFIKVFHAPTIQQLILTASTNMDNIPKNVEALLFAIYSVALASLDEAECEAILGESKVIAVQRFRSAAQYALINVGFLKSSDIMVLQAFVLFLVSVQDFDARILWILTGVASRIGQRIGLHRDGEALGLQPFEVEVRRRLWWQLLFLEGFSEKLAGTGSNMFMGDTKPPLNINDSDLFRDMKEYPKEHDGATEMMFFLIRCHVGVFLKRNADANNTFDGVWHVLSTPVVSVAVKDKAIEELDSLFQQKFLRNLDRSIPWHFMCEHLAKAVIFMMRFVAHSPERRGVESLAEMPQSEKDMLFHLALQVTTYQNFVYTMKEMHGFIWHVNAHFQWKAFIYVVSELRHRTAGPEADEAWKQVRLTYESHPKFSTEESKRALPVAISTLTLKAWDAYTAARETPEGGEPGFIQTLRARMTKQSSASNMHARPDFARILGQPETETQENLGHRTPTRTKSLSSSQWGLDFSTSVLDSQPPHLPAFDPEHVEWSVWDNLLTDFRAYDAPNDIPTEGLEFTFNDQ